MSMIEIEKGARDGGSAPDRSGRAPGARILAAFGLLALVALLVVPTGVSLGARPSPVAPPMWAPFHPPSDRAATQLADAEASLRAAPLYHPAPANTTPLGWTTNSSTGIAPSDRAAAAIAYDPLLSAVVLFGGYFGSVAATGDTWEYANGTWTDVTMNLTQAPSARWEASMTYDALTGYVVLFGGRNTTQFFNDTWMFNGTWTELFPSVSPSPRGLAAMAYDPSTSSVVLFGGGVGNVPSESYSPWSVDGDTWVFSGGSWTNVTAFLSAALTPTAGAGLGYDPSSGNLVLLGGSSDPSGCTLLAQQAVINLTTGSVTTSPSSAGLPYGPYGFTEGGMATDPALGGIVLFGGTTTTLGYCQSTNETWLYTNGTWTNLSWALPGPAPPADTWFPMAYDGAAGAMLLFGGNLQNNLFGDATWLLSGTLPFAAHIIADPTQGPPPLAVNFTGNEIGAVGNYSFAWNFGDGNTSNLTSPQETFVHVGVYQVSLTVQDSLGRAAVTDARITVGYFGNGSLNVSVHANPSQGPAPLNVSFAALVTGGSSPFLFNWSFGDGSYSPALDASHTYTAVGNYTAVLRVTDSNGLRGFASATVDVGASSQVGTWWQVNSTLAPSTRSAPAMAYDPELSSVILFGGYLGPSVLAGGDTWEYSNGSWSDLSGALSVAPPARWEAGFAYDPATQSLILFGGRDLNQFFNDTWSFNASGWTQLSPATAPSARGLVGMTYDAAAGAIVLFGGGVGNVPAQSLSPWRFFSDTWEFAQGTWTNVTGRSTLTPPAVAAAGLAYDPAGGFDLLYGGTQAPNGCAPVAEEWEFRAGNWTDHSANLSQGPGGLTGISDFGLTYDPAGTGLLFFGGVTSTASGGCYSVSETWGFSPNGTWTNLTGSVGAPVPVNRHAFALSYDGADGYALLFGGNTFNSYTYLGDTWAFLATATPLVPIPSTVTVVNPVGSGPLQVTFQVVLGAGFTGTGYSWAFGDGATGAGFLTASHVYTVVGLYLPQVTVSVAGGRSVTIHLPAVRVLPTGVTHGLPSPGHTSSSVIIGWPDVVGVAAGLIGAAVVWVALDARQRRLRDQGIELARSLEDPPRSPPAP